MYDAVNLDYIVSFLFPEVYFERRPSKVALKTSIAWNRGAYPLTINALGNGALFLFPSFPFATGVSTNTFALGLYDTTFSPATGIQTPAGVYSTGPLA